jgi:tRNA threonylcarbamoyl adenosine modification protein YeaZ
MPAKSSERPPLILACDTTQGACSVALYQDRLLGDACQEMTKGHAEALMPMLEKLCADAGIAVSAISRIGVTHGPGTFTGVRVGLAAMRGLALALNVPVKTYGTLAVMAAAAHRVKKAEDPLLVAVDAKRDTFYAQIFDPKGAPLDAPAALSAAQLNELVKTMGVARMAVCGTGAPILSEIWDGFYALDAPVFPKAAILAAIAAQDDDWHDLPPAEPLYLRPPDASLPDPEKRIQWRGARPN